MRDDIAESYEKMRQAPAAVIYSDLPDDEIEDRSDDLLGEESFPAVGEAVFADDKDFVPDDDDFELAAGVTVTPATEKSPLESSAEIPIKKSGSPSEENDTEKTSSPTDDAGELEEMQQEAEKKPTTDEQSTVAHSVATGGDALLQVAMEEEAESKHRRTDAPRKSQAAKPRYPDGILIYCPNGHRIEVRERHRGMTGRCPRCKSPFFVPEKTPEPQPETPAAETTATTETAASSSGKYQRWLNDVNVHTVNRKKLKLKPGSLEKEFELVDFGFSDDSLLAVKLLVAKKGKKKGKKESDEHSASEESTPREQILAHLREGKPLEELPVDAHYALNAETVQQIKVAQPIVYAHESMFAGVPVFGDGRIAVWLSGMEADGNPRCASFSLSQFREFAGIVSELLGLDGLGDDCGVPLTDSYSEQKCEFSEDPIKFLTGAEFYQADPAFSLKLLGWQCEGCGIVVSEDARKKEKIGGPKPQSVPKAKCPKCKKKFGNNPLYALEEEQSEGSETESE